MTRLRSRSLGAALVAGVLCSATPTHAADLVLQWNEIFDKTGIVGEKRARSRRKHKG